RTAPRRPAPTSPTTREGPGTGGGAGRRSSGTFQGVGEGVVERAAGRDGDVAETGVGEGAGDGAGGGVCRAAKGRGDAARVTELPDELGQRPGGEDAAP